LLLLLLLLVDNSLNLVFSLMEVYRNT